MTTSAPSVIRCCFVSSPRTSSTMPANWLLRNSQYSVRPLEPVWMAVWTRAVQCIWDTQRTTWPGQSFTQDTRISSEYACKDSYFDVVNLSSEYARKDLFIFNEMVSRYVRRWCCYCVQKFKNLFASTIYKNFLEMTLWIVTSHDFVGPYKFNILCRNKFNRRKCEKNFFNR